MQSELDVVSVHGDVEAKMKLAGPSLFMVTAEWCHGPCNVARKVIGDTFINVVTDEDGKQTTKYRHGVKNIMEVSVDDESIRNNGWVKQHGVSEIPCVLVYHKGEEVTRCIGIEGNSEDSYAKYLREAVDKVKQLKKG